MMMNQRKETMMMNPTITNADRLKAGGGGGGRGGRGLKPMIISSQFQISK